MSIKVMSQVLEDIEVSRIQQAVLLAMANHANDHGGETFPSVDRIAWIAGYKPRAIVNAMQELTEMGVLEMVAPAAGRRAAEYQIHLDRAPRKQSFEDWKSANSRKRWGASTAPQDVNVGVQPVHPEETVGVHSTTRRGAKKTRRGAFRDTTLKGIEPIEPIEPNAHARGRDRTTLAERFDAFWEAYPRKRSKGAARRVWERIKPDQELTDRIIATIAVLRSSPEWSDPKYIPHPATWLNAEGWEDAAEMGRYGPPGVELLSGETAVETAPGCWELTGADGRKRYVDPGYCGVVFDTRIHTHDGRAAFDAAVRQARQRQEGARP